MKKLVEGHSWDRRTYEEGVTPGPRRLVDVVFSRDGFGAMVVEKEPKPFPDSGVFGALRAKVQSRAARRRTYP